MATLAILGTSSGAPEADAGCASYLVTHEGTSVLLDCGPGTLGSPRAAVGVHALGGVFISHMHSDHFLDLVALNVALWTEPLPAGASGRQRIPVFLPPDGLATLTAVFQALTLNVSGSTATRWADALDCREYAPGEAIAESTYPEPGANPAAGHTSAHELGEIAAKAGCRSLIATHFAYARRPAGRQERERAIIERIRGGGFAGDLAVAAPGRRFEF